MNSRGLSTDRSMIVPPSSVSAMAKSRRRVSKSCASTGLSTPLLLPQPLLDDMPRARHGFFGVGTESTPSSRQAARGPECDQIQYALAVGLRGRRREHEPRIGIAVTVGRIGRPPEDGSRMHGQSRSGGGSIRTRLGSFLPAVPEMRRCKSEMGPFASAHQPQAAHSCWCPGKVARGLYCPIVNLFSACRTVAARRRLAAQCGTQNSLE